MSANYEATVSIRGCGLVSPSAGSAAELLDGLSGVEPAAADRGRRVADGPLLAASGAGARKAAQMDRFSLLALGAARRAFEDSKSELAEWEGCGMVTGTMVAGWTFTEPQLERLHRAGVAEVSPYLATAWFPAAPQGQVSIGLGLRGYAKTLATDRCAGAQAIGAAFERIREGRSKLLLAGGAEAPVTPLVEAAAAELGGGVARLSEAACYLLLAAGGPPGPRISAHQTFPLPEDRPLASAALTRQLQRFWRRVGRVLPTAVVCNVPAEHSARAIVVASVESALGDVPTPQWLFPADLVGDCLGASGAVAAAAAYALLARRAAPACALVLSVGHQCADLLWMQSSRKES